MDVIKQVRRTENIAVITFENAPANIGFLSFLFDTAAKEGVNVDMISQTSPKGTTNSISFTVIDNRVTDIFKVVKQLECVYSGVKPSISIGNVKICLFGNEMPSVVGVAADVFNKLNEKGIEVVLITTSDVDISIVVQRCDSDAAYEMLKQAYEKTE